MKRKITDISKIKQDANGDSYVELTFDEILVNGITLPQEKRTCFASQELLKQIAIGMEMTVTPIENNSKIGVSIIGELKEEATKKKKDGNFKEALELYKKIWKLEQNEWNGFYLAQCFRKTEDYVSAREFHLKLAKLYPTSKAIKNDKLWLDYSDKIKNWENPHLITDAEEILAQTNQYDKYTNTLYTKTVLNVVKYLIYEKDNLLAFKWLKKLNQTIISNNTFSFQGQIYPADRKIYFIWYAHILINLDEHTNYIKKCLIRLNFRENNLSNFKAHIIENITFGDYISRIKLAKYIKHFQEEIHLRGNSSLNSIYNQNKITLISDLSHLLFCPVSFAINETFTIEANSSWEKDEWLGEKKSLLDRYNIARRTKSIEEAFKGSNIEINPKLKSDFDPIFNSDVIINNVDNHRQLVLNESKDLRGAPDYIMSNSNGIRYSITEKFSSIHSSEFKTPFESDLVKHYAYLEELKSLDLSFGIFINWFWELVDVESNNGRNNKKIIISSYKIFKVEKNDLNKTKLNRAIDLIKQLKKQKTMTINRDKISHPNKCLNCSVFSYCNHKTGNYNQINIPYDLSILKIIEESEVDKT